MQFLCMVFFIVSSFNDTTKKVSKPSHFQLNFSLYLIFVAVVHTIHHSIHKSLLQLIKNEKNHLVCKILLYCTYKESKMIFNEIWLTIG